MQGSPTQQKAQVKLCQASQVMTALPWFVLSSRLSREDVNFGFQGSVGYLARYFTTHCESTMVVAPPRCLYRELRPRHKPLFPFPVSQNSSSNRSPPFHPSRVCFPLSPQASNLNSTISIIWCPSIIRRPPPRGCSSQPSAVASWMRGRPPDLPLL